ncbi:hypothetical protein [Natronobacterium gregoryi]|uniref:Uncharacterized protein n=2 Tax=Natronobacterium gregoryi TaxID=44930 RepID=L0AEN3_NATGS|nr:hypothetical protein [Natronobacterium gregoryi]AFZ72291.1 hypothetical protein Natgr_1061 [Natronobacterium gregoryi SP2]ELY62434.1 hypothetical protein C490_18153 [Natronobacterium gregoryi SP2]PLK18467.1 hypothetical protein CYV19_17705 [Natronobacterium gregoryi SP2]SFJ69756.1 hypothetical protein SAMN05443661_1601 [Natronobacterium gregoryi]
MGRNTQRTRRRLLGVAGATASAILVAGCADEPEDEENGVQPEGEEDEDPAGGEEEPSIEADDAD